MSTINNNIINYLIWISLGNLSLILKKILKIYKNFKTYKNLFQKRMVK